MLERIGVRVVAGCLAVLCAGIASLFNSIQPAPYMDEVFHVPQAQNYCHHNFTHWDPMITTLPGLYFSSLVWLEPLSTLLRIPLPRLCSTSMLRVQNVALTIATFLLLHWMIARTNKTHSVFAVVLSALSLTTLPVLFFFSFLYYTDVGSTFLVLLGYALSLRNHHFFAATVLLFSVCFRQTNIVWVVFVAGSAGLKVIEAKFYKDTKSRFWTHWFAYPLSLLSSTLTHLSTLTLRLWPYLAVVLAFLTFVVKNGSIVVGDKSHHQASFHVLQLFYFVTFACAMAAPHFVFNLRLVVGFLKILLTKRKWMAASVCLLGLVVMAVHRYTYAHPYLLADNRHFPFYLWKNIFKRYPNSRYWLAPLHTSAILLMIYALTKSRTNLWIMLYLVCCFTVLVPQQLIEFRYYIIPFLIFRIHISKPHDWRLTAGLCCELALYSVINVLTIYLFLYRPFEWPHLPGQMQRFMW